MLNELSTFSQLLILIANISLYCIILILFKKFISSKFNPVEIKSDELVTILEVLKLMIDNYKTNIVNPKMSLLESTHDLDPESKTYAMKKFIIEKDKLIIEATKDIITKTLSVTIKRKVLNYFSEDGLILFIVNTLRG